MIEFAFQFREAAFKSGTGRWITVPIPVDAALRNAVLLRGEEIFTNPEEMGVIVETTVLRHLYAYYYRDVPTISYWRDTATQKEVDIIVQSPRYTFPFEVKYQENPRLREASGLVAYCKLEKVTRAYWVAKQDRDFDVLKFQGLETEFLKVPAHVLCYTSWGRPSGCSGHHEGQHAVPFLHAAR